MENQTMREMFERLDNGTRMQSPAVDKSILFDQSEATAWNDSRDGYVDYMTYAMARTIDGKSHEQAIADVERNRKHR